MTSIRRVVAESSVLSVSQLTSLIKDQLEGTFTDLWVEGELTGVKFHSSGHVYFSLKDASAQITCTLWRSQVARLRFRLSDGLKVVARGSLSVYEPRGTYSLNVTQIDPRGLGALQLAFEQLKARLQAEGLFEASRKRQLPFLCTRIGIVTSPTGAALQDILKIIFRRNPNTTVIVAPARVQGTGAAEEIVEAIRRLNHFQGVDVIIVGRGGGSIEDLWSFNEEMVARAIAASELPVVSAVGHEVDVTIADFVADVRAPTPSAAAELVVRERHELLSQIHQTLARLQRGMSLQIERRKNASMGLSDRLRDPRRKVADQRKQWQRAEERLQQVITRDLERWRTRVNGLSARLMSRTPVGALGRSWEMLALLEHRLIREVGLRIQAHRIRLGAGMAQLDALSPLAVLGRGYAIARLLPAGSIVRRVEEVQEGSAITVKVSDGSLVCIVQALTRDVSAS